jgi:hypothetical protein
MYDIGYSVVDTQTKPNSESRRATQTTEMAIDKQTKTNRDESGNKETATEKHCKP